MAEKTVEFHTAHLLAKLGARSRTEAVLKAVHHGIVLGVEGQPVVPFYR